MDYDAASRTFGIYTENVNLIGMRKIEIDAELADYPSNKAPTTQKIDIEIIDVCLEHFTITSLA